MNLFFTNCSSIHVACGFDYSRTNFSRITPIITSKLVKYESLENMPIQYSYTSFQYKVVLIKVRRSKGDMEMSPFVWKHK